MILYHKNLKIDPELLSLKKKIKYSDNFIYIPIKYNGKDILLQTPDLFIPFNINKYSEKCNKNYLDLSFQSIKENNSTERFITNLETIHNKVYRQYNSIYEVSSFIKENKISKWMRFKIQEEALFFNQNKEKIQTIESKTYGVFIISLSGLWIMNNKVWFNWLILQAKIYIPIQLKEYVFFEEESKKPPPPAPPPPPPLPPPPQKNKKLIFKKKKEIIQRKEDKVFQPSISEITLALKRLNKIL